jgi:transcriptional regulator with GAF, ATPase, and Fis domain
MLGEITGEADPSMTEDDKGAKNLFHRGEEFLTLYQKVENFTRELMHENEKLRFQIVALEQENKNHGDHDAGLPSGKLADEVSRLLQEKEELVQRYKSVEKENLDFARRYVEIEEENNNLANLYVASYQLHSTLEYREVLQIVREIIINLIGADRFAVFMTDSKRVEYSAVVTEGIEDSTVSSVIPGEGALGKTIREDSGVYVAADHSRGTEDLNNPLVVIPLKIKNELIGVIAIYNLLEQKKEFTPLDIELFNLLGGHAATAIFGARLFSESKRKLSTIQGFLELLKPERDEE